MALLKKLRSVAKITQHGNELPEERSSVIDGEAIEIERENKRLIITSRRLKFASLRQLSQGSRRAHNAGAPTSAARVDRTSGEKAFAYRL